MKKWEQQKSKLLHEKKVQSAKSTLTSTNPNKTSTSFTSPNGKSQMASHYSNISQSPIRSTQTDLSRVSHNSQISDYYEFEKMDLTTIPLYRLLKHYSLQQYAKALISRGYGYDLSKFATLARNDMDKLFSEINMIPGHKVKLMKLASQVTQICTEIMDQDDLKQFKQNLYTRGTSAEIRKPKTANAPVNRSNSQPIKKKPATSAAEKKPTFTKNGSTTSAKKPMSSSQKTKPAAVNKAAKTKKKLEKIGFDFFSDSQQSLDDEFSKVLDSILGRYQDQMEQNSHFDGQPIFTQSRKAKDSHELLMRVNYSEADQMKAKLQGAISDFDSKDESGLIQDIDETSHHENENASDTRYNTNSPQDDTTHVNSKLISKELGSNRELNLSQVVQEKKSKADNPAGVEARARILELIEKKVDQGHLNKDELNVEFKKIKDMYSSFDGAKMTSTIANLDIEEMSYCLACAIEKHVEYFVESIEPNGDFSMPVNKIEPKKEFNIQQLRYNFEQNLAKDDPNTLSISSGGRVMPKAKDDIDLLTLQQQQQQQQQDNQRFKLQGDGLANEDNVVEEVEEDVMEGEDKLGNNLEGVEVVHKEEDDEVMHSESMGIGIIDDDEEEKVEDEEIEEYDGGVNFRQMEEDMNENMYKTNTPLDPYVTSQLEIISEKSYEASHNTVKLQQAFEEARRTVGPHDEIKQEIEENDREIEDFLRESLRDSILFNLKQEKQQENKEMLIQEDRQESSASASGLDNHSLQGFTMQIHPTEAGEYLSGAMDLRSQVMNGGPGAPQMKQSDLMMYSQSQSQFNGTTSEILYQQKEKDWRELSMEESLYSELQWDNQNMDIADRIKMVFERTYNEKNITPEEYNKRIKHTVDKSSVQNYCKNIVITTKMEKEVVIICLIYIERLIVRTNMYLSALNWKRITFAALILASKIWDDESFENNNFARAFPQYTTKEINELEKVFLEFLDYNLMINGNDYAKYYFILRTFAEKNKKSFPLKALNLQTVRNLQKKAAYTSKSLKEIYSEPLNKTFS